MIAFCQPPPPEERLPRVSRRQWYGAAIHEAGHAVACLVAGWQLQFVEVATAKDGRGHRVGRCRPDMDHLRRPDARGVLQFPNDYEFRLRYCTYTLSGPSAEFELLPEQDRPEKPCSDDVKYALEDAAVVFPDDPTYQRKFYQLAGHDAGRLVRRYSEEIETVARALVERRRLTGRDVDRLLGISQ